MKRIATILSFVFLVSNHLHAQYFQSTNYKEGSGLPSSESYQAFQDSRGFIWIGTDNGVVKFDGQEFVTYNSTHGLTDNTVFGFYEDSKGRIWFRTYNGALSYMENDTIKSYKYNKQLKEFITSSILQTIKFDSTGQLYFSTINHAIAGKVDASGNVTALFGDSTDNHGIPMQLDKNGRGWYFVGYALDKAIVAPWLVARDMSTIKIDDNEFDIDLDDEPNQNNWIIGSVKWRGKIYFSMHKNIFTYDGKKIEKVLTTDHNLISLYVDHEDRLWTGYFNNGVQMFTDELLRNPFSLGGLSNLSVSSVIEDYEGGIWISTLDQGVFYFPNLTIINHSTPNNTRVNSIAYDNNQIFLGNYGGEIFRMNEKGQTTFVSKGVAPVSNLFVDSENKLWISDGAGTHIHETGKFINGTGSKARAFRTLIQSGEFIYGCTSIGILKMTLNGDVLAVSDSRRRPTSMALTDNEIFIGNLDGLEKEPLNFSSPPERIGDGRISLLLKLNERFIAVGTISQGLFIYDSEKQKLAPFPIADVVNIYSMISDWALKTIWIGTDKGLFQLGFEEKNSELVLDRFSKADGLISNKINKLCRMGGDIWAISDLGISTVPLSHFGGYNYPPKFYINRILFKNLSITVNASPVRTEESDMVMDVRPISFRSHPTQFRYRLGEDQPWQMVLGGSVFLTDLKPDTYYVEVQASLDNTTWTESLTTQIDVIAQWWDTWAFRWSVIFVICVLGYVAYLLRINAIRRKHRYLELINHHQQKLIDSEIRTQERERKRIATDLHDGIGTSLSSIKMQVADAMLDDGGDRNTRAKEINDHLTDVIDDIKRIVYDLHPPGLERYGLQSGLKNLVERINKSSEVNVIFDYYGQRDVVQPVAITIFRILQELLNNTLKHARASEIRIHINEFDDEINIMYEDNGIGMIGSRFTGLGLHSIESRVRSLNGRMSWESNHKGTFYNFDIPF